MLAVESVIESYRGELSTEAMAELPAVLQDLHPAVELVNEGHWIARWITVATPDGSASFELRRLDLYELAERYPELGLGR